MITKRMFVSLGLILAAGAAQAEWLDKQPQSDPVHKVVARVVLQGCEIPQDQFQALYSELGGNPDDAAFHVQMMFKAGEVINQPNGDLKLHGVAGC